MNCQQLEYNKFTDRILLSCYQLEYMESLSSLFRRRISELGITNAELARRAKKSRSYVGNIINETAPTKTGKYELTSESVKDFAKALEITEAEILNAIGYDTADQPAGSESVDQMLNEVPEETRDFAIKQVKALIKTFVEVDSNIAKPKKSTEK